MTDTTDVTSTLAELERKLRALEHELTSIGRRRPTDEPPASPAAPAAPPAAPAASPAAPAAPPITPAAPPFAPAASPIAPATPPAARATGSGGSRVVDEAMESPRGGGEVRAPGSGDPLERRTASDAQLASLAELRRFRDRLERFAKELSAEYDALLGRVMSGLFSASSAGPGAALGALAEERTAEDRQEEALFEGRVELGVGPFYDIASLSAFERRLASLPSVSEAAVRRFEASHAVVDIRLAGPVALVRELRRAEGTEFSVREVADGRILLTFDDA